MAKRLTAAEISAARKRSDEAEAKAASRPGELTEAELAHLRPSTLSKLVHSGELSHLGVGGDRSRRATR